MSTAAPEVTVDDAVLEKLDFEPVCEVWRNGKQCDHPADYVLGHTCCDDPGVALACESCWGMMQVSNHEAECCACKTRGLGRDMLKVVGRVR